jgi:hypothetical protein
MRTQADIDEIRKRLREFVEYTTAEELKQVLHTFAKGEYIPKNSPARYLEFMNDHVCSFEKCHPQSTNHPYYFGMFSVISQHVYGDVIEECLDQAIEFEKQGGRPSRIWYYKDPKEDVNGNI